MPSSPAARRHAWSLSLALSACWGPAPEVLEERDRAWVERYEAPPPKPPNCPAGNGTAGPDIRIVTASDVPLYLPADWVSGYFVDSARREHSSQALRAYLQNFTPDIHSDGCPGTVHVFRTGQRASPYGGFWAKLADSAASTDWRSVADLSVVAIVISPTLTLQPVNLRDVEWKGPEYPGNVEALRHDWRETARRNFLDMRARPDDSSRCVVAPGSPDTEMIASRQLRPNLKIGLVFPANSAPPSSWRSICDAVAPIFDWMRTPPADRPPVFRL